MTPLQHYAEAERLLALTTAAPAAWDDTNPAATLTIAEAQVHATLALAGATALATTQRYVGDGQDITEWAHLVQPKTFEKDPCAEECMDIVGNGCPPRCADRRAKTPFVDMECPF